MIVAKTWGHERIVENNDLYCLKILVCEDRIWSSNGKYHYHKMKDETFLVIEGVLEIEIETEIGFMSKYYTEGSSIRIKPGVKHRFRSVSRRCKFIEASTQNFEEDSIRTEYVVKDKKGQWIDEPGKEQGQKSD